jgi:hypothetical protein
MPLLGLGKFISIQTCGMLFALHSVHGKFVQNTNSAEWGFAKIGLKKGGGWADRTE